MVEFVYKGLTGILGTATIADPDSETIGDLIVAIAADEGLPTDYYAISVEGDPAKNDTVYDDSSIVIGGTAPTGAEITVADRIICTPRQTGTKERRQIQKLEIAKKKREGGLLADSTQGDYYRQRNSYDRDLLPTKYTGNSVTDNPNPGGLQLGRPWF